MNTLIDPRPLEPACTAEPQSADFVAWRTERCYWDRESRSTRREYTGGAGNVVAFLHHVSGLLRGNDFSHTIQVEAAQAGTVDLSDLTAISYPCGIESAAWWEIDQAAGCEEAGLDGDELFGWLRYLLNERKDFSLKLSDYDPTP